MKVKDHHLVQLFLNIRKISLENQYQSISISLEKYLELWGKKSNIGAFLAFKKFEDNSDMHLDFKK